MLAALRERGHAGLVLFSSGTTGRPKAILHDFEAFLARYRTPRPTLRTLSFLMFDHIGGINTLFHTLFNAGQVVVPEARAPHVIVDQILAHDIELLPTTPTFLRLLLLSGEAERLKGGPLRIVTYGTERMDPGTLARMAELLPATDFRQTYGMSELGILRVRSEGRTSLFMAVGGEGVETRVRDDGVLEIRSESRMLGYMNAPSPFDAEGWYDTRDLVECRDGMIRITGRNSDVINVGGQKILPSEIERIALDMAEVKLASAAGVSNPITGQHIELTVEPNEGEELTREMVRAHFDGKVASAFRPHRIRIGKVEVGHRFKQR